MKDPLSRLQTWYLQHCDGNWEHESGVRIDTIDNPGWSLSVDLEGTSAAKKAFSPVKEHRSDADWLECRVEAHRFEGFGGPSNLQDIILVFLNWAEPDTPGSES